MRTLAIFLSVNGRLCSLEKYEIEKIKKESSLNKRKERQQPCLHNQSIYFKRTKTKQIIK